jgi:hypothetical protein
MQALRRSNARRKILAFFGLAAAIGFVGFLMLDRFG